jgi:hypothetical protein
MASSKFGWGSTSFQTSLATFPSPMFYFPATLMMKGSNGYAMAASKGQFLLTKTTMSKKI